MPHGNGATRQRSILSAPSKLKKCAARSNESFVCPLMPSLKLFALNQPRWMQHSLSTARVKCGAAWFLKESSTIGCSTEWLAVGFAEPGDGCGDGWKPNGPTSKT